MRRLLLLAMGLVAVSLVTTVGCQRPEPLDPASARDALIAQARELGARVDIAAQVGDQTAFEITWKRRTLGQPELDATRAFQRVTYLDLTDSTVSLAWYRAFDGIPGLKTLNLAGTDTDDLDVERILWNAPMEGLTLLGLADTQVTDEALPFLIGMPNLRMLDLQRTALTDRGLDLLPELPKLKRLRLQGTQVTAEGVARLQAARPEVEIQSDFAEPTSRLTDPPVMDTVPGSSAVKIIDP